MKVTPIRLNYAELTHSKKINKYIEVVVSDNPRLNDLPEDARLTLMAALSEHYAKVSLTIVNNLADLERLVAKKPDLVVLGLGLILLDPSKSYDDSPKVWLSSYLKESNINFIGSSTEALILQRNKNEAKQRILESGLQTAPYFVVKTHQLVPKHSLTFPLFVKPTDRGDGKGIDEKSLVYSETELKMKVLSIHADCGSDALIEEYLPGREFSVAVVQQLNSNDLLVMPIEVTAPVDRKGNSFLTEAVKKADTESDLAVENSELKKMLSKLAISAFKTLGARDYGRIDIRLNRHGQPNFIEANLLPGLSKHGYLARCFNLNQHISYPDMILAIVALGFMRSRNLLDVALVEDSVEALPINLASILPVA